MEEAVQTDFTSDNNQRRESLSVPNILFKIIILSIPVTICTISFTYSASVILLFARSDDPHVTEGLAAFMFYYNVLILTAVYALTIGFQVIGSNAFGAGKGILLGAFLNTSLIFVSIFSIIMILFANIIAPGIYTLIPMNEKSKEIFLQFLKWISISFPFFNIEWVFIRYVNILQKNFITAFILFASFILQILLSLIFTKVLNLQEFGLALAFIINHASSSLCFGIYIFVYKVHSESIVPFRLDQCMGLLINLFCKSATPFFNLLFFIASFNIVTFLSLDGPQFSYAAFTIFMTIATINFDLFDGVSTANSILCSFYIGKQDKEAIYKTLYVTLGLTISVSFCLTLVMNVFSFQLIGLFTESQVIFNKIDKIFVMSIFVYNLLPISGILSQFIVGIGKSQVAILINFICSGLLMLTLGYVLNSYYGLSGLVVAVIIGILSTISAYAVYIISLLDINERINETTKSVEEQLVEINKNENDYIKVESI